MSPFTPTLVDSLTRRQCFGVAGLVVRALTFASAGGFLTGEPAGAPVAIGTGAGLASHRMELDEDGAVVGRSGELDRLTEWVGRAVWGAPARMVLVGEPGIGKTVLWNRGVELARAAGARVLITSAGASERGLVFEGLADVADGFTGAVVAGLAADQRGALVAAVPRSERAHPDADELAVCLAVLEVLRGMSAAGPLVVAVDDIQWLDEPTARVLAYALRRVNGRVGLLASARAGADGPGLAVLEGLDAERLTVGALGPPAIDALVRARLGRRFTPPVLRRLVELVGGNPLHALELARALPADARLAPGDPLPVPATLAGLLAQRLTTLPRSVQAWLAALAVSPRPSPVLSERLEPHVREALAAGLLETDRRGQLRFVHPLLVAAAQGLVSAARRRAIHRRLAELADDPEQQAAQLALGAERPTPTIAAALDRAAARASRRGAPAAAAELAEQAARLTPPASDRDRCARRRTAALHHVHAGEGPRARTLLSEVIDEQVAGPERARSLLELASISEETTQAIAIAQQALTEAGADRALLASIHQLLGSAFGMTGDLDRWEHNVTLAAQLAVGTSPSLAAGAMSECALVRFLRGGGVQRELGMQAVTFARAAPDGASITTPLLDPEFNLAIQLLIAGELDEARTLIHARRCRARDGNAVSQSAVTAEASWSAYLLTELELRAGNWALADQHAQAAAAADASRAGNLQTSTLLARALVDAHLGRVEHAREAAVDGLKVARTGGERLFVWLHEALLGFIALSVEDPHTAHRHLGPAVAALRRGGFVEPALPGAAPDEIEALIALGELAAAQATLSELQGTGERLQRRWAIAAAHRCRALLASATGDHESAIAAADAALDAHRQLADPFGRARTLLARGEILGRAGHRREADQTLGQARGLFTQLGATLWITRTDRATQRLDDSAPDR